jgi:hypothetical protein
MSVEFFKKFSTFLIVMNFAFRCQFWVGFTYPFELIAISHSLLILGNIDYIESSYQLMHAYKEGKYLPIMKRKKDR